MMFPQLLLDGVLGAVIAAGGLASLPDFQPVHKGWLPRFGWFLLRYGLPLSAMLAVSTWFVLKR